MKNKDENVCTCLLCDELIPDHMCIPGLEGGNVCDDCYGNHHLSEEERGYYELLCKVDNLFERMLRNKTINDTDEFDPEIFALHLYIQKQLRFTEKRWGSE